MAVSIRGETLEVSALSQEEQRQMLDLMLRYYQGINALQFERDLSEKKGVMLMRDSDDAIIGFSTYMILDLTVSGKSVKGFFSGDTIVHETYRKTTILAAELGKNFLALREEFPCLPAYWMLISKGCRTYCLLPLFFHEFYPRYDQATPEQARLVMDVFGWKKYPDQYDHERGIITFSGMTESLKPGVADADELRLRDPHVRFFAEANPNHMQGDELVCLARIAVENFSPIFRRILKQGRVAYA